jgi:hypothetical protein
MQHVECWRRPRHKRGVFALCKEGSELGWGSGREKFRTEAKAPLALVLCVFLTKSVPELGVDNHFVTHIHEFTSISNILLRYICIRSTCMACLPARCPRAQ